MVMVLVHPVRRRREAAGLSQGQLAAAAALRRETINRLEAGRVARSRGLNGATLRVLADALEVDEAVLAAEIEEWDQCRAG